jgi:hypothetical protein
MSMHPSRTRGAVLEDWPLAPRDFLDLVRDGRALSYGGWAELIAALPHLRAGVSDVYRVATGELIACVTTNGDGCWRITGGSKHGR